MEEQKKRSEVAPTPGRNDRLMIGVIALTAILIIVFVLPGTDPNRIDDFAMCLSSKNVSMYGSVNCGACDAQKELFGPSFGFITYVECYSPSGLFGMSQACRDAGIQAYPTWSFPDGSYATGMLSFEELSLRSGCALS